MFPGDLCMWAGPPGAGKSAAALNYALLAKVPTLYVSMDMGPRLITNRVLTISTGETSDEVSLNRETDEGMTRYEKVMQDVDHLYITYPSRPDPETIARAQMAFIEIHGYPSQLMIVDNLMNMDAASKDEWTGLRELSQAFHYFVTELEITVLLLHHINLAGVDLTRPAPLNAIKGQVSELPASIVTFAKDEGRLLYTAVKNRHGNSDPTGKKYRHLDYHGETQTISDPQNQEYVRTKPVPRQALSWDLQKDPQEDWASRAYKD